MPAGFESKTVWKSKGRGFQMGVIEPDGVVVHLTGQVAWDANEEIVGKGDVEAQARKCFENIRDFLAEVGGSINDIVAITTYFTHPSQLNTIQLVRQEFLTKGSEPASTSVMVAGLGHPDFLVELTPIAVIPKHLYCNPGQ